MNFQGEVGSIPVGADLNGLRGSVRRIVEQVHQRGAQRGVHADKRCGQGVVIVVPVLRGGAQQLPLVQHLGYQMIGRLQRRCHAALGVGQNLVKNAFAAAHLFIKGGQRIAPGGTRLGIAPQLADHHRHGGQRRAQFMRCAGSLRAERHDAFIAQDFLAYTNQHLVTLPYRLCHFHHEIGYHHRADDETEPHAYHMRIECAVALMLMVIRQRNIIKHQHAVTGGGNRRHAPGVAPRQRRGGNHQRQQVNRNKGIGRAAAIVKQDAERQHIDA